MLAETFLELVQSAPHWGFEILTDAVWTLFGALFVGPLMKRHDRKHHHREPKVTRGWKDWPPPPRHD